MFSFSFYLTCPRAPSRARMTADEGLKKRKKTRTNALEFVPPHPRPVTFHPQPSSPGHSFCARLAECSPPPRVRVRVSARTTGRTSQGVRARLRTNKAPDWWVFIYPPYSRYTEYIFLFLFCIVSVLSSSSPAPRLLLFTSLIL